MTAGFTRLIRETAERESWNVWDTVALLARAKKLKGEEQFLAVMGIANALIRRRRLIDLAEELIEEASRRAPNHLALSALAELADIRGNQGKAKALRALAQTASDAPTEAEELRTQWAAQEIQWRKNDASNEGKRARLDAYFGAQKSLIRR